MAPNHCARRDECRREKCPADHADLGPQQTCLGGQYEQEHDADKSDSYADGSKNPTEKSAFGRVSESI